MSRKSENTAGPSCPIAILPDGAIRRLNEMETGQSIQSGGFLH
ncbi:hypothetical protein ACYX34_10420 [Nitrospira sp. CMX1]